MKNQKRLSNVIALLSALILAVVASLGVTGYTVWAEETELVTDDGQFTYSVANGAVTIIKYNGDGGDVVIPGTIDGKPVKEIGAGSFLQSKITSVEIPEGVIRIGGSAFWGCTSLNSIKIPDSVTHISQGVFTDCHNIKIYTNSYSYTADWAVCYNLYPTIYIDKGKDVVKTEELTTKDGLFSYCVVNGKIVIMKFNNADAKEAVIPENIDGIPVRLIGRAAFAGCSNLTDVKIPDGVTMIGDSAFNGCSGLTSIEIPDSVKYISNFAFCDCSGLKNVKIPNGVASLGYCAFEGCIGLTSIKIPDSVTYIDTGVFYECSGLTSIEIPDSVTSIGGSAFRGCKGLTSIEIPDGVTCIGTGMFENCSSLTSIEIPNSVTSIGHVAFHDCSSLTSIEIPDSVTSISNSAFKGCDNLTIYCYKNSYAEEWATENGFKIVNIEPSVTYHTHIQTYGDSQGTKKNGEMAGTSGEAKRLENIWIDIEGNDNLGVQYSTHCQSYGWMPWSCDGETNGTSGEAKRLEAIKIQLTGADKDKYDIYYRVHAQSYGWLGWAKNGEPSGTAGYAKRLEGIQVVVVKKGEAGPALNYAGVDGSSSKYKDQPYVAAKQENIVIPGDVNAPIVSYKTHVQSFGWQKWVHNGAMSGTSGQAKRLEGINIKVTNCPYDGDIVYTTHVQTYGWQGKPDDATRTGWKKNGEMSGTSGEAKRLEAICIDLTGEMGEKYDIYYRVHAQSFGWLDWAMNGEESGTAGYGKRLEGIQIVLVEKGGAAPANNYGGITSVKTEAYLSK